MSKMTKAVAKLGRKEIVKQKSTENNTENSQYVSQKEVDSKKPNLVSDNCNNKSQGKTDKGIFSGWISLTWVEKSPLAHLVKQLKGLQNIQREVENKENIPDYFGFQEQRRSESSGSNQKQSTYYTPFKDPINEGENQKG